MSVSCQLLPNFIFFSYGLKKSNFYRVLLSYRIKYSIIRQLTFKASIFLSLYTIHYDFTSRNGKVDMLHLELT